MIANRRGDNKDGGDSYMGAGRAEGSRGYGGYDSDEGVGKRRRHAQHSRNHSASGSDDETEIRRRKTKGGDGLMHGRWTQEEHELFLRGLRLYGREWKKVAADIRTRSSAQIRSHAQKYFAKLSKERTGMLDDMDVEMDWDEDEGGDDGEGSGRGGEKLEVPQTEVDLFTEVGQMLFKLKQQRESIIRDEPVPNDGSIFEAAHKQSTTSRHSMPLSLSAVAAMSDSSHSVHPSAAVRITVPTSSQNSLFGGLLGVGEREYVKMKRGLPDTPRPLEDEEPSFHGREAVNGSGVLARAPAVSDKGVQRADELCQGFNDDGPCEESRGPPTERSDHGHVQQMPETRSLDDLAEKERIALMVLCQSSSAASCSSLSSLSTATRHGQDS